MTPVEVKAKVDRILSSKNESHRSIAALSLYMELMRAIADGKCQSPSNCAAIALELDTRAQERKTRLG